MFMDQSYIEGLIKEAKGVNTTEIERILDKANRLEGLDHSEVAKLLYMEDDALLQKLYTVAGSIKKRIYGDRVVMFAPLYVSDYCVNNCTYCGYQHSNCFARRKLTQDEIRQEVRLLEKMGHKRLALEVGEDPVNCPIEYVIESIGTIYDTFEEKGSIRRINVNVAATTVEDYKKLKEANIGTYILFQETYHKPTYEAVHPDCLKGDYVYHLTAFDRAMEAGLDDVGGGVLFGLADHHFEVLGLMLHNEHLEKKFGVGFHTISVPRLKKAAGMDLSQYPHIVTDTEFKKIIAIIRLAVPYTGIILSTRENEAFRKEAIAYGVSQVSAGSCTGVGSYKEHEEGMEVGHTQQFIGEDHRSPLEVVKALLEDGYIPSYCTACYRSGRTGDRFMQLAKSGSIQHVCGPNALMTLMEFLYDYGDEELMTKAKPIIYQKAEESTREDIKKLLLSNLKRIEAGERDLFL